MLGVIILVMFNFEIASMDLMQADACVTPYNENATCEPPSDCKSITSALFTFTPQAFQFAKDSLCGCDGGMVCCGTSNNKPYPQLINCAPVPQLIKISLSYVSDSSICGLHSSSDKIKGGSLVKEGEFPWLAALEYQSKYTKENVGIRCGGSIITKRFILTAAHCILDVEFEIIKVWLGVTNLTSEEICRYSNGKLRCINSVQKLNVEKTFPHEFYSSFEKLNDIGLLQLEADIEFSNYIRPICLPSKLSKSPSMGTHLTVAGWGATENDITQKQLCVGGEKGQDSCEGDSGGPLMYDFLGVNGEVQWSQQGIVSYGSGCGIEGRPGVYIKVSSYVNWIFNKINNQQSDFGKNEPCTTQNGTIGTCVLLNTCHEIFQMMLNKSAYYSYRNYLERYQCGTSDGNLLVCCENQSSFISQNFNTTQDFPDKTTCGIIKKQPGIEDNLVEFPWIVGIEVSSMKDNSTEIRCIGTVINSRYVLTSIPCIFGKENDTFEPINVWLGCWNSSKPNNCNKFNIASDCCVNLVNKIGINKIIPYPLSIELTYSNNALIFLEDEIKLSGNIQLGDYNQLIQKLISTLLEYISPICLYSRNLPKVKVGETVTRVRLLNSSRTEPITSSDIMVKEQLPLVPCYYTGKENSEDDRPYVCLTGEGNKNCGAMVPYGAPLMRRYEDKESGRIQWYLVTVTAWNDNCDGDILFYSDSINDCLDWIITIISENS